MGSRVGLYLATTVQMIVVVVVVVVVVVECYLFLLNIIVSDLNPERSPWTQKSSLS